MRAQLSGLDNESGNIDTIANRISHVRTWAYVSYKKIGLKIVIIG